MEYNDGNRWHYVQNVHEYLKYRDMYEMRACSAHTDGTVMYKDPRFHRQREQLQPLLKAYLHYQFPYQNAGSPEKQADFFCDLIGTLRHNEMVMLDTEHASGLHDPADFLRRWSARVENRLNTLPWVYVPRSLAGTLDRAVTGPRIVKAPKYSGNTGKAEPPDWSYDVWQYTDRGFFPGCHDGIGDVNTSGWTPEQLLAHCQGRPLPDGTGLIEYGDRGPVVHKAQRLLNAA